MPEARVELACRLLAETPGILTVAAASDLVLRRAIRQEVRHLVDERDIVRDLDEVLIEHDRSSASWAIERSEWERVLLAAISDGSEPVPGVVAPKELANSWLVSLRNCDVAGSVFPQARAVAEVRAVLVHPGAVALGTFVANVRALALAG